MTAAAAAFLESSHCGHALGRRFEVKRLLTTFVGSS